MKIAYVLLDYVDSHGHGKNVINLVEHYHKNNEVHIFANTFNYQVPDGVSCHRIWAIPGINLFRILSFFCVSSLIVKKRNFNIIHSQSACILYQDVITAHICHDAYKDKVGNIIYQNEVVHMQLYHKLFNFVISCLESLIYKKRYTKKIVAVSKKTKEEISSYYRRDPDDIEIVYNAVDIERFNSNLKEEARNEVREKFGISNEKKIVLFVGQFRMKGLEYALRALADTNRLDYVLIVVGDVPDEYFLKLVDELKISGCVKWVGKVDGIELYYKASDLLIYPSLYDSCSLVVLEAVACLLPVICSASDYVGAIEMFDKIDDKYIIHHPTDVCEVKEKIYTALNDLNSCSENSVYMHNIIVSRKLSDIADENMELYEQIMENKKKAKILVIGHHFVTKNNQRRIEELSKHKDSEISLLCPYWWREESRKVYLEKDYDKEYAIYKGRTLFTNSTALSFYLFSVYKLLWRIKPDIIDIYEEPWSLTTLQILLFKMIFLRKSKVMFYSAQNISKKYPFPFNFIEKFTFSNADYCYPCSKGVEDVLRVKGYKGKISVVPLGLDISDEVKRDKGGVFTVGFIGRLVEEKGIIDLVNACNQLNKNYKLLIVGEGPLKSRILKIIKFRNIADKIEFTGAVKKEDIPEYYVKMDVLVAPSRTTAKWKEQFGRMITEAFMYGVPVIGSDSGSIPEVMAGCGLIYREGNVSKLRDAILSVMNDQKARAEMIKRGREYALSNYTWAKTTGMIKDIYNELYSVRGETSHK